MLSQHASREGNRLCVGASATGRLSSPHASRWMPVWLRCSRSSPKTVGPSSVLKPKSPKLRPQSVSPTCRTAFPAQICGGLPEAFSAFHYTKLHKRFLPAAALFL